MNCPPLLLLFLVTSYVAPLAYSQDDQTLQQRGQPGSVLMQPAGRIEAAKHPLQLDPPLGPQARQLDPAKLRAEADELAKLAQSVPEDIALVTQGKLPKDMADKLRRIEKLSKHLRGELVP